MITIHNSGNTRAVVRIALDEMDSLGPFPTYVGSYDNLKEVAKAAAVDTMVKSGWSGKVTVTRAVLGDTGMYFDVTVRHYPN